MRALHLALTVLFQTLRVLGRSRSDLILENPTWGAPRIHGELLTLGFDPVSRYVLRDRPGRGVIHEWLIFLRNHREAVAAMDFLTVPTVTFRVLYVWFVIHHDRRKVLHFNVTEHPTALWVIQRLRESFPYDTAPSYLVFDRDSIFAGKVTTTVESFGIEPSAPHAAVPGRMGSRNAGSAVVGGNSWIG